MIVSQCNYPLILASRSPRRKELLAQIGIPVETLDIEIDERVKEKEAAIDYVQRIAFDKAQAALGSTILKNFDNFRDRAVLTADTSVVCDEMILGKPDDYEHACKMLSSLAGRKHQVMTAVALATQKSVEQLVSVTDVEFAPLSEEQIRIYCDTGEGVDKAGAYAIQGKAAQFVVGITGSYSGVVGLPLYETSKLLKSHYKS